MPWTRDDERDFVEAERERHLTNIWVSFLSAAQELEEWAELWDRPRYRRLVQAMWRDAVELHGFHWDDVVYIKEPIPQPLRRAVLDRDRYTCQLCGSTTRLAIDHIEPESRGGTTTLDNLRVLCQPCNNTKGAR
jgi:hypothetical protein